MTEVFNFILTNIGRAFTEMSEFQLFEGLSLLEFLVVLLVLHVCVSLFFGHIPRANADRAIGGLFSTISKHEKTKDKD